MRKTLSTGIALLFLAGIALAVAAEDANTYQQVSRHYEAIRMALLEDSLTGVTDHATSIEQSVAKLLGDFQAERAGVAPDKAEDCQKLLAEIATAAREIKSAEALDAVRAAFFELSKPLGRYRRLTGDLDSKVAYCPMVKKAWVQPGDEVGNPYLGTEMPNCGQIIAD